MKEEQSRQRDNGAGAKTLRRVGETAGRPVCLEWSEGGGEGQREADHVGVPRSTQVLHRGDVMAGRGDPGGGDCSSPGCPVPGLLLWAWAPDRGETPLSSSWDKQAEAPGKGPAGDPTVAE